MMSVWFLITSVFMVKHSDFKTCQQSSFCIRQRAFSDFADKQPLPWRLQDLKYNGNNIKGTVELVGEPDKFVAEFYFLNDSVRFQMVEQEELYPRYRTPFSLEEMEPVPFTHRVDSKGVVSCTFGSDNKLVIYSDPFHFEIYKNGVISADFNDRGYLYYEPYRKEPVGPSFAHIAENTTMEQDPLVELKKSLLKDLTSESFNGNTDSKPKGASSIGFDVGFPGSKHVFGIPEHATSFSLKSTRGPGAEYQEPYRLYNLDVFEYVLDTPMSLYGAVPFMMSHKKGLTSAVLFLNSAEMWIDVEKNPDASAHWMAESGIIDLFFFTGPTQQDIFNQYTKLTGRPQLPQKFSVAYHQCRWNYNSEQDALEVDAKFDEHLIPYDVLWLDIEHTDGKRYFTWDNAKFPNPIQMQETLSRKGRKMVTIIDPHMKADDSYYVAEKAKELDILVKNKDDTNFEGHCWPGSSFWIDYSNPKAREYWAEQFLYTQYQGSTPSLYTWNDMNEPSVFTGPEITMPKDVIHHGNVEHRDIHNAYGMLLHRSTFEGHLKRSNNQDRPFILSRAFFVGTQRYGCIWTGDNTGEWSHLEASIPMLLSIGIAGITNAGADVGGFFLNPDGELILRWYQIGSLQPFFRAHAHIDTKRREPWLYGEPYMSLMKEAVERRYRLLPYIYTLFEESSRTGNPVMRSMMQHFPDDEHVYGMDSQYMFGNALVVKPVSQKGQSSVTTYLPLESVWYDYDLLEKVPGGEHTMDTPLHRVPVYLRGGTIVPRKDRIRRSSSLTTLDPYTLIVAVDEKNQALGNLYVDDGHSYEYQNKKFIRLQLSFDQGVLKSTVNQSCDCEFNTRVERIIFIGMKQEPERIMYQGTELTFVVRMSGPDFVVTVKNPNVQIGTSFEITIE